MYQFGFKTGHLTGLCTNILKHTVNYYSSQRSHVFLCFVDFSKAFDKVNYWMGDRVRAGKPSRYVASQLGRLSLLPSVGW